MAEYCLLTLPLCLIIIEGFRARRAKICSSTLQKSHSEGRFLEIKLFLTYSLKQFLFKICTSIHHMVLNYQQKIPSDFILKSCQYFCFKYQCGHYITRVSRHSGCWITDIKYGRTWIFLHIICLPYTLMSRNAG